MNNSSTRSTKNISDLWVEKYRPETLDEVILDEDTKKKFEKFIKEKSIPNLLLVGERGTGKSTLARILIKNIIQHKHDVMKINGSLDNSIDVVRDKVITFLKTQPIFSPIKIIHYEEFDRVSHAVQPALRDPMEVYAKVGRFILTCNYEEKIIEPIKSRCMVFKFKALPKDKIRERLEFILDKEKVKYKIETLNVIIDHYYPSMRDMIKVMQQFTMNGMLVYDPNNTYVNQTKNVIKMITELFKETEFNKAIMLLRSIDKALKTGDFDYIELSNKVYDNENIDFPIRLYFSALITEGGDSKVSHLRFMGVLFRTWNFSINLK